LSAFYQPFISLLPAFGWSADWRIKKYSSTNMIEKLKKRTKTDKQVSKRLNFIENIPKSKGQS